MFVLSNKELECELKQKYVGRLEKMKKNLLNSFESEQLTELGKVCMEGDLFSSELLYLLYFNFNSQKKTCEMLEETAVCIGYLENMVQWHRDVRQKKEISEKQIYKHIDISVAGDRFIYSVFQPIIQNMQNKEVLSCLSKVFDYFYQELRKNDSTENIDFYENLCRIPALCAEVKPSFEEKFRQLGRVIGAWAEIRNNITREEKQIWRQKTDDYLRQCKCILSDFPKNSYREELFSLLNRKMCEE